MLLVGLLEEIKMFNINLIKGIKGYEISKIIRETVFLKEQGFKEDYDEIDDICTHCILYVDDQIAGCARFFVDENNHMKLGRFAILKQFRKKGYGKIIVNCITKNALELGYNQIYLSGQVTAVKFYENCGFKVISEAYLDEHCEHVDMVAQF